MNTEEKNGEGTGGGERFGEALNQARKLVPSPVRGHSDAMLAAQRLAFPFAQLRANQLRMEAVRAAPGGERAAAFTARADAADRQLKSIEGEIARLRIVQPDTCEGSVTVYGYVRDKGEPLAGAVVALFDGDEIRAQIDSDKDGAFTLSVCSEVPLGVEVRMRGKLAHRDRAELHPPSAVAAYRVIDIAEGEMPGPVQDPPKGECKQPGQGTVTAAPPGAAPQFRDLVLLITASDVAHELGSTDDKATEKWLKARGIKDMASAREAAAMPVEEMAKSYKVDAALAGRFQRALCSALGKLDKS